MNINDVVKVKLTVLGYKIYNTYTINNFLVNKVNKDNIIETELWEIMKIFGPHFYVGADALFEDNKILV